MFDIWQYSNKDDIYIIPTIHFENVRFNWYLNLHIFHWTILLVYFKDDWDDPNNFAK